MKKGKKPILVIFCILLLLVFIVLPPFFRKYFPKKSISKVNIETVELLKCNRFFKDEMYQVSANIRYIDSKIIMNQITYTKQDNIPDGYIEPTNIKNTITVNDEYTYLSSLNGLTPIDNSNSKIITINDSSIKNNINEIRLSNYYQKDINKQKKFYEDMGYTCNILK